MHKAGWMGKAGVLALLAATAPGVQAQAQRLAQGQAQNWPEGPQPPDLPPRADDDFSDVTGHDPIMPPPSEDADPAWRDDLPADANEDHADQHIEYAITDCAIAARDEAERDGGYAEIRQMQTPREVRNGWDVEGVLNVRSGWRAQDGAQRSFTCAIRNGRITDIRFHGDRRAR